MKKISRIVTSLFLVALLCLMSACSTTTETTYSDYYTEEEILTNNGDKNSNQTSKNDKNQNTSTNKDADEEDTNESEGSNTVNNSSGSNKKPTTSSSTKIPASKLKKQTIKLSSDNKYIKTQGRTYEIKNGIGVDNAAAGIEFNAYCHGDVTLKINPHGDLSLDDQGAKFVIVVDGETTYDVVPKTHTETVDLVIAEDLSVGDHSFGIYRMTPSKCDFISLTLKGNLTERPADKNLKIAFLGDSITVGHYSVLNVVTTDGKPLIDYNGSRIASVKVRIFSGNTEGTYYDMNYVHITSDKIYVENTSKNIDLSFARSTYNYQIEFFDSNNKSLGKLEKNTNLSNCLSNSYDTYAVKTAKALNADWEILGKSGITMQNFFNKKYYTTQVGRNDSLSYSPAKADVVVINLATNSFYDKDPSGFGNAMTTAVKTIKEVNSKAKIIFIYGSMRNDDITKYWVWQSGAGYTTMDTNITAHHKGIRDKVTELNSKYGDVYSFEFSTSRDAGASHPSMAGQAKMAKELAAFIKNNIIK